MDSIKTGFILKYPLNGSSAGKHKIELNTSGLGLSDSTNLPKHYNLRRDRHEDLLRLEAIANVTFKYAMP